MILAGVLAASMTASAAASANTAAVMMQAFTKTCTPPIQSVSEFERRVSRQGWRPETPHADTPEFMYEVMRPKRGLFLLWSKKVGDQELFLALTNERLEPPGVTQCVIGVAGKIDLAAAVGSLDRDYSRYFGNPSQPTPTWAEAAKNQYVQMWVSRSSNMLITIFVLPPTGTSEGGETILTLGTEAQIF